MGKMKTPPKNVCAFLLYGSSGERVSLDITLEMYTAMVDRKKSSVTAINSFEGVDVHGIPFIVDVGTQLTAISATADDDDGEDTEGREEEEDHTGEEAEIDEDGNCSLCGALIEEESDTCDNCGATLVEDEDEDEEEDEEEDEN
jgi:hypothetical protein